MEGGRGRVASATGQHCEAKGSEQGAELPEESEVD